MSLHRAWWVVGAVAAAVLLLAHSGESQPTCQSHPAWDLSPSSGWIDAWPTSVHVSGLCQGAAPNRTTYTITLTSTDADNVIWSSSAEYQVIDGTEADGTGTIDLVSDSPTGGSYEQTDQLGLHLLPIVQSPADLHVHRYRGRPSLRGICRQHHTHGMVARDVRTRTGPRVLWRILQAEGASWDAAAHTESRAHLRRVRGRAPPARDA